MKTLALYLILISLHFVGSRKTFLILNNVYSFETKYENDYNDSCNLYNLDNTGPTYDFPILLKVVKGLNGFNNTVSFQSPIYGTYMRHTDFKIYMDYQSSGTFNDNASFILRKINDDEYFIAIQSFNYPSMLILSCNRRLYIVNENISENYVNRTSFKITAKYDINCSVGWMQNGTYCYLFYRINNVVKGKNWYDSFLSCQNYGGNLLSIADEAENAFIKEQLKNEQDNLYWIGLNISSVNKFAWSDNTISQFSYWNPGEPNNWLYTNEACVEAAKHGWNDCPCDAKFGCICKYKIDVSNDNCSYGGLKNGSHCYLFYSDSVKNWYGSLLLCRQYGDLLSVTDQVENSFIVEQLQSIYFINLAKNVTDIMHYWIGLNSYPMIRNFSWSDNTTSNFTNWISGEPNNENDKNEACAAAKYNGWIDYICQATLGFICKAKVVNWSGWSEWSTSNQNCIKTRTRSCNSNQWLSCSGESATISNDIFCNEFSATPFLSSTITAITSLEFYSTILVLSSSPQSSDVFTPLYSSTKNFSSIILGEFSTKPFSLSAITAITLLELDSTSLVSSPRLLNSVVFKSLFSPTNDFSSSIAEDFSTATPSLSLKEFSTTAPFLFPTKTICTSLKLNLTTLFPTSSLLITSSLLNSVISTPVYLPTISSPNIIVEVWSTWSECSVSCGNGYKTKRSLIMVFNVTTITEPCIEVNCPVNGMWSKWISSECSKTCSGGILTLYRTCDNPPPAYSGRNCVGINNYTEDCSNDIICPVNGNWSKWSKWSICNQPCNGGIITRSRNCTNPSPKYSGMSCCGDYTQSEACSIKSCKTVNLNLIVTFLDEIYDGSYLDLTSHTTFDLKEKIRNSKWQLLTNIFVMLQLRTSNFVTIFYQTRSFNGFILKIKLYYFIFKLFNAKFFKI
ncbi:uncharacterized protein LOC124806705 isoform X3 [Hydra vulgaris]|uniref:Uncharacterized protein LOC124806705 isoform X3 n=1 Tax=Hydra vulgaris TaxID=6087 RepID=A0ABM4C5F2_HYDVU